jgi:hypothetical protein
MKRFALAAVLALSFAAPRVAHAETIREEKAEHPRIAKAIEELHEAVKYLEAAPHDFGGHKAEAIEASKRAIEQLKLALAYRAAVDTKKEMKKK